MSFVCEFCNNTYQTISNLNHHKKTAKFCIDLQNNTNNVFKCKECKKEFTMQKYLNQHLSHCKVIKQKNKIDYQSEITSLKNEILQYKSKLENQEKDFKNEINKFKINLENKEKDYKSKLENKEKENKIKLENKDEIIKMKNEIIKIKDTDINKLQKENTELKKLATRPTNIYNTNNNTNNYQIQYNQLVESIETLNKENISKRISLIEIQDITKHGIKNFENSVSNSLSNIFKDFTFCTDKSRKTVVIKKDNNEIEKVSMDEFIQIGLTLGIKDIINIIEKIETFNDYNIDDYDREEFATYDESLQKIKDYLKLNKVNVNDKDYPLPSLAKNTLSNCTHLNK